MIYTCANAYYFRDLNIIGGIESHLYYIVKKYSAIDIMVFYRSGSKEQVQRLSRYARVAQIKGDDKVFCDNLFCCFNREILSQCDAKKRFLVLHGDYLDMVKRGQMTKENLPIDDRIDEYLSVSQQAADSWEILTGLKARCIYEPVILEKSDPILLMSATRLTPEKGWERMRKLAKKLNEEKVNFLWLIFTNSKVEPEKNMVIFPPRLDVSDYYGLADAFVQLSDNEGYCLSVVESLLRGTPVITTPIPLFKSELGMNEKNQIELDFEMNEIPIDKIRNVKKLKEKMPEYKAREDKWMDVLKNAPTKLKFVKVKATGKYAEEDKWDAGLGYMPKIGEEWETTEERAEMLKDLGFVEIIKNKKSEPKKESEPKKRGRKKKDE